MYDDLYCKVFLDTDLSYEALFTEIINHIGGEKESFRYIVADWCDMFVQKNKEHSMEHKRLDAANFLYWKYYLDVEPRNVDECHYIKHIANLLGHLRQFCNGVIAACDFEDALSQMG